MTVGEDPGSTERSARWEYHRTADFKTANLNALGAEGWEVCGCTGGFVILKRRLT